MSTQHEVHVPEWTMGDRLRKAREEAGLSQSELAAAIKVSRATVSNAEVGARHPLAITVGAWARATGVPEAWLLTGKAAGTPSGPDGGGGLPRLDSNQEPPGSWSPSGRPALKVAA